MKPVRLKLSTVDQALPTGASRFWGNPDLPRGFDYPMYKDFEGDENAKLKEYATTDSPEYKRMVEEIARRLGLTTLRFNKIESLIESIGLPKCKVCTHCFDGSSCCFKKMKE